MIKYTEIKCETACHKTKGIRHPFDWDLNIYRGCVHGCKYCYALYSHDYLQSGNFYEDIYIKTNVAEKLERQLASHSFKNEIINIGGVTDSYQPIEAKYKLMPDILKLLIKYKVPCIISTKSNLILRDFDLIEELASLTYVNIASTITCMDESIRQKIEPKGVPSLKRFEVLEAFSKTKASTGLHLMPIIPYLTDDRANLDTIFSLGQKYGITYILPGVMYLRGKTRGAFFSFIKKDFPALYEPLMELYKAKGSNREYKDSLYAIINELRTTYKLSSNYSKPIKEILHPPKIQQLSLFD